MESSQTQSGFPPAEVLSRVCSYRTVPGIRVKKTSGQLCEAVQSESSKCQQDQREGDWPEEIMVPDQARHNEWGRLSRWALSVFRWTSEKQTLLSECGQKDTVSQCFYLSLSQRPNTMKLQWRYGRSFPSQWTPVPSTVLSFVGGAASVPEMRADSESECVWVSESGDHWNCSPSWTIHLTPSMTDYRDSGAQLCCHEQHFEKSLLPLTTVQHLTWVTTE